jgi:L-lactate dehydrogenase (cytochrome)/(S)-mandelate dehydrogenase
MAPNYNWDQVARLREIWKGQLLVKGILHPNDAAKAVQLGCDGIYVSNHGGRQLNTAPAPFEMLPLMRKAVGDKAEIVVDSGIRRGTDVVLAHCLGASMCFMGRAPNYGVAAGGLKGVLHTIDLTRREVEAVLGQIGCNSIDELGPHMLFDSVKGAFMA